jgi:hypothetical protein
MLGRHSPLSRTPAQGQSKWSGVTGTGRTRAAPPNSPAQERQPDTVESDTFRLRLDFESLQ